MEQIFDTIKKLLSKKPNAVIGIDGHCACGKTTLAMQLAEDFGMQIIHMDDFFLPFEMRTDERFSQPGGNVHYERFNDEVASCLDRGEVFAYRVFSCKYGEYRGSKAVSPDKPLIIEGTYALHPEIKLNYDLKIFMKADYETRLERILKRNGEEALEVFKTKWIPLEDRYFENFGIESECDIIKQTGK